MMRGKDLARFAAEHDFPLLAIQDLVAAQSLENQPTA